MGSIVGVDEVGRGCLAGPLVAGAVILHKPIKGLTDSKLLAKKERVRLSKLIYKHANVGLGWVSHNQIDQFGLTKAISLAMDQAVNALSESFDEIVIDGNYNFLKHLPNTKTVIKADLTVAEVSAASIVAKVARDEYMVGLAKQYPNYYFETNVGYGTPGHLAALKEFGASEIHRQSYRPVQLLLV